MVRSGPDQAARGAPALSNRLVLLMAVATGAVVANLYYSQPLLHEIARTFQVGTAAGATVVTFGQAGYAAGLLLVVPLGDLHPRRSLVVVVFVVVAACLLVCAAAPAFWLFELATVVLGCAAVAGQVMIPFAADLAPAARRGRVVARMMTGLLFGILLARTFAGLVAGVAGWRAIYWVSAGMMLAFAVILRRWLPVEPVRPHLRYTALVRSVASLLRREPVLRRRAWFGAWSFAGFSVLWTTLAFLLSGPPYHYSNTVIGLFGLVGVGGVVAANTAGRLADAHHSRAVTVVCGVLLIGAFALMEPGRTSLAALVAGIVVLDIAVQAMQITNQAVNYALVPEARSRVNSAYMFCYFIGGSAGSLAAGFVLADEGWTGVCALGAACGLFALVPGIADALRPGHREPEGTGARERLAGAP